VILVTVRSLLVVRHIDAPWYVLPVPYGNQDWAQDRPLGFYAVDGV